MNFIKTLIIGLLVSTAALADPPCNPIAPTPIGAPVPGLTPAQVALFNAGKVAYEKNFTVAEGLGPLFRERACVTCHGFPVTGGSDNGTVNNVTHFMINNDGNWMPALELGGPVIQHRDIRSEPGGASCPLVAESVPPLPKITTSLRHSPPVFGFGLLDAVADEEIREWQGKRPWKDPSVIGFAQFGTELESLIRLRAFTFDISRRQPAGAARVGRFGWKAQTPTLFQFTTEPFNIELGISTPFFPRENSPNGAPLPAGCLLAGSQPNDALSANSLKLFHFQALLAAPAPRPRTPRSFYGELMFRVAGCADCHRPTMRTARDYYMPLADGSVTRVAALSNKLIAPYSDLLIHDMGPGLEDGRVMGAAGPRFWRTTPLWGTQHKTRFLHDGSAANVHDAIERHGGEGAASVTRYDALNAAQKAALIEFVEGL